MSWSTKDSAPKSSPRHAKAVHAPLVRPTPAAPSGRSLRVDNVSSEDGRAYVTVSGVLEKTGAELVASMLQTQFRRGNAYVRLDVSGVTALDAPGVAVLVRAHQFFLHNRGTLVLAEVPLSVQAELTRLAPQAGLLVLGPSADQGESASEGFAG